MLIESLEKPCAGGARREYEEIRKTRFAIATTVRNQSGEVVGAITLVGPTPSVRPRVEKLGKLLIRHVDSWAQRSITPREPI